MRVLRHASLTLPAFTAAFFGLACQTQRPAERGGIMAPAAEPRAPRVRVDGAKLAASRPEACRAIVRMLSVDADGGARRAGMLLRDYEAFRRSAAAHPFTVTFRDSNPRLPAAPGFRRPVEAT